MISYPISARKLWKMIDSKLPGTLNKDGTPRKKGVLSWRVRASKKEKDCWTDLKETLQGIQGEKCGYCECALKDDDATVDHFRPQGRVNNYSSSHAANTGGGLKNGYDWLAYNPTK